MALTFGLTAGSNQPASLSFEHEILLVRHRMQEQLLTVGQVAEYLSVDKFTIYRLVAAGQLPAFKVGNQWRFKKSLIEGWLKAHSSLRTKAPQRNKYRRRSCRNPVSST
jgi:excisionase family DNA binding protein